MEKEIKNEKWVTPIGEFNCQSFPINEDYKYLISEEDLVELGKTLMWSSEEYECEVPIYEEVENEETHELEKVEIGKKTITKTRPILVPYDNSHNLAIQNAKDELKEIHKWLCDNDWKVNKIVIGEWQQDDERWLEYLQERQVKRARQDELNNIIKGE